MDHLISLYKKKSYILNDANFSLIAHQDAIVATVYKITRFNGEKFILKICSRKRDFFNEVYFLNYFSNVLPCPRIIDTIEPTEDIDGAIVMEYVEGNIVRITDITDYVSYEMGSFLARIHMHKKTYYGDLTKPDDLIFDPHVYFTQKFHTIINECKKILPARLLERCKKYFDSHSNLLEILDSPCITHRDFRPGNIIVSKNKIKGIIDWSSARSSLPEEDFCRIEHSVWSINPKGKDHFLAGYLSVKPIPKYDLLLPILRINQALDIIDFTFKSGTWNNRNIDLYEKNKNFLETFFKL